MKKGAVLSLFMSTTLAASLSLGQAANPDPAAKMGKSDPAATEGQPDGVKPNAKLLPVIPDGATGTVTKIDPAQPGKAQVGTKRMLTDGRTKHRLIQKKNTDGLPTPDSNKAK